MSSAQPDARMARFAEVDAVKGVGILAVVLIHSLRGPWDPGYSEAEEWLGRVARFAVPGFFAASGYLYATGRAIPREITARRLVRVFVPYLVASAVAQAYFIATSQPPEFGPIWRDLLLASSFGPYYFVLMLAFFIAASPLLARIDARRVGFLLISLLVAQFLLETSVIPPASFFWHLRNPFLWAGYFVLGWWLRQHRETIVAGLASHRARWLTTAAALWLGTIVSFSSSLPRFAIDAATWFAILAALALCFAASAGRNRPGPLAGSLRWLSDASYPIYLFHIFFIKVAAQQIEIEQRVFEPEKLFAIWACGVVGPIAIVWLGRTLLGARSRTLIGA